MPIVRQQIFNMHQWTNWEVMFSMWCVRQLHDATVEELLEAVFSVVHSKAVSPDQPSSVQLVQCSRVEWVVWRVGGWVNEWVRGLLWFSSCELLLLEAGSRGTRIVQLPRERGTSAAGSHYQVMTGEDSVHAVVNCRMCELPIAL
jgi:hypothetical protein